MGTVGILAIYGGEDVKICINEQPAAIWLQLIHINHIDVKDSPYTRRDTYSEYLMPTTSKIMPRLQRSGTINTTNVCYCFFATASAVQA
jgi:hypothetical protein